MTGDPTAHPSLSLTHSSPIPTHRFLIIQGATSMANNRALLFSALQPGHRVVVEWAAALCLGAWQGHGKIWKSDSIPAPCLTFLCGHCVTDTLSHDSEPKIRTPYQHSKWTAPSAACGRVNESPCMPGSAYNLAYTIQLGNKPVHKNLAAYVPFA